MTHFTLHYILHSHCILHLHYITIYIYIVNGGYNTIFSTIINVKDKRHWPQQVVLFFRWARESLNRRTMWHFITTERRIKRSARVRDKSSMIDVKGRPDNTVRQGRSCILTVLYRETLLMQP